MKIHTLTAVVLALSGTSLITALPAQAQTTSPVVITAGQLAGVVLTPKLMAALATSPKTWQSLIDLALPFMTPYAEEMRQLALKQAPTLKPVASQPNPPTNIVSNSYSQVVSFGDSMSDTGNMFEVTKALGGTGLPTAPNDRGRFSNGPVVLEAMSNALNRPLLNYAFGGAQSANGNLVPVYGMQVGMLKQIQNFLSNQGSATTSVDAKALYVLWTGPDDYYAASNIFVKATGTTITANIRQGMVNLYQRGARNFFVPLMPDLSITPSATEHNKTLTDYKSNAKLRSGELAASVTAMLQAFAKQYPLAKVRTFDTYTYSQTRMAQAATEGINVTTPCYTPPFMGLPGPVCSDPDQHLFWDTNHPTAAGSLVIGTAFAGATVAAALPSR
jgi:phospholipase/lecithinase/hemolysin